MIRWAGATPVPLPITEEPRFAFSVDDLAERLTPQDEARDPQLAREPDRRHRAARAQRRRWRSCSPTTTAGSSRTRSTPRCSTTATHDTIASHEGLLDRTILLDGFSKTFAMTGWRLGYAALPKPLVEPITRLIINSVSCTAPAVQLAGVAALEGPRDEVDAMMAEFRSRRDARRRRAERAAGRAAASMPNGAFYAFPNVTGTGPRRARARRTACSTRPASRCSRARRSASTARATCASRTPTRSRTSRRRSQKMGDLLAQSAA